ncbi:MAG: ABC transporter ATP-binding protein [Acidobacteria bacterium]|nr:ABC transporter ATP-binding protein [Acidobacteriota bacterium]
MIEVEGISKRFGSVKAVDQLSLKVEPGQIVGLLGPNGAGKTTTMRIMCGISPPDSGAIRINGIALADEPVAAKAQLAFVPAEPRLFDYLTVAEHIAFFAKLYAAAQDESEGVGERTERFLHHGTRLIEQLELADRADFLPGALSRGMKQKLMFACALVHEPNVLVFDEPFTGLDPHAIRKVRLILQEHIQKGAAIIISSHLLGMVEDMVNHIIILNRGKKMVEGTMGDLRKKLASDQETADLEEIFIQLTSQPPVSAVGENA